MTSKQARSIWLKILDEKFKEDWTHASRDKLRRLRFGRNGEIKENGIYTYAKQHYRNVLGLLRIRMQAVEIPKRKLRVRPGHHRSKQQMSLLEGNQLNLF